MERWVKGSAHKASFPCGRDTGQTVHLTCDGAVIVVAGDPGQPHAPLGQVCQLQVTGPVGSFCWPSNETNEAGIVPGAGSPSSQRFSREGKPWSQPSPGGERVPGGTIHVLQLLVEKCPFF